VKGEYSASAVGGTDARDRIFHWQAQSRKHFMNGWATRLLLLWVACAVSYFFPDSVSAATKIRIGYSAIMTTQAPLWAAEDRGLFKKYGLGTEKLSKNH
jgi:ABC-type nitrate/sulfonate/bicarbonate transport system substrate-binding protein